MGAYTSGADAAGRYYISTRGIMQKLQDDLTRATLTNINPKVNPCDDPNTVSYMVGSTRKKCPPRNDFTEDNDNIVDTSNENKIEEQRGNYKDEFPFYFE
mgnify:FL=1|jgi:hypothetical protein